MRNGKNYIRRKEKANNNNNNNNNNNKNKTQKNPHYSFISPCSFTSFIYLY